MTFQAVKNQIAAVQAQRINKKVNKRGKVRFNSEKRQQEKHNPEMIHWTVWHYTMQIYSGISTNGAKDGGQQGESDIYRRQRRFIRGEKFYVQFNKCSPQRNGHNQGKVMADRQYPPAGLVFRHYMKRRNAKRI